MKKKLFSLFMIVALIVGMLPTMAFAAGEPESKFSAHVNKETVHIGEEFTVTVSLDTTITKDEDITNVQCELYYDKELVEYVSHELTVGEDLADFYAHGHRAEKNCVAFSRTSMTATAFKVNAGNMLSVTFKAKKELTGENIKAEMNLKSALTTSTAVTTISNAYTDIGIDTNTHEFEGATCLEPKTCKFCGHKEGEPLGHTPGAEATCTEPQECTVCHEELAPANGHTPGTEPTCTQPQECTVCHEELAPANGHTPGAGATCTDPQECTVCHEELTPANGHTPGAGPTCTEPQECIVCHKELAPALGHDMKDATCTEASQCKVCGHKEGEPLGHTPGAEPTCTESQECTVCHEELAPANGHTPGVEPTCTDPQECTVCHEELAPANGHKGGTATANQKAVCEVCGEEYGDYLVEEPTDSPEIDKPETDKPADKPSVPETSDGNMTCLYLALMALAASGALAFCRKREDA